MGLDKEQRREMQRLQKQQLDSAHGKAEPITEEQELWLEKATQAMVNGEDFSEPAPSTEQKKLRKTEKIEPKDIGPLPDLSAEVEKMVDEDVNSEPEEDNLPEDPEEAERLVKEDMQTVSESFMKMAEKQGKKEKVMEVIKEYPKGDPYFGTVRGKIVVLRPLYEDEQRKAMGLPDEEIDKFVAKTCVVVGLSDLLGKDGKARAGLYATLARNVMRISDMSMDMDELIVPVEVE